ncbi:MAG: beta strand repeat-containing protein, partial [Armatimonadota bacterium]
MSRLIALLLSVCLVTLSLLVTALPAYAVNTAPTITSFAPTSGKVGDTVTITGMNFTGATSVSFNGTAAVFTVDSDTAITATVPESATTGMIALTTPGGTTTSVDVFTVYQPPTITSFAPTSGKVGDTVTLSGTNFTGANEVSFNGTTVVFTVDSDTAITATVPESATTGPIAVTSPGGTTTSVDVFTVYQPPTFSSFAPTSGKVGDTVTITGMNFTGATSVSLNGTAAVFTVDSDTAITATVPEGATTGPIAVTTPGGIATSVDVFTVYQPPTITSFAPNSGKIGDTVTVAGTNLLGATTVSFNGTAAVFTVDSDTAITATVPESATTGPIAVTTPGGIATSVDVFTVYQPPTITYFTPTSGKVGDTVTLSGTNLLGATSVSFNGTAAVFTVDSDTTITSIVPEGATTGPIAVTSPGGIATSVDVFTVYQLPTITSFAPNSGKIGDTVTIAGMNFTGANEVSFNGTAAVFTVDSDTAMSATVPVGATTGLIAVTTPGGTAISVDVFTVNQPPTITSFTPTSGKVGDTVTIAGTNLLGATAVSF